MVVVISCRWGTLHIVTGSSASKVAAMIGKAAFFAPEMLTVPSRGLPPLMISLSMRLPELVLCRRNSQRGHHLP